MTHARLTKLKHSFAAVALALVLGYSNSAHSMDIDAGAKFGLGRQYSGAFGPQLFLGYQRVRIHAGIGLLILSVGADVALTKHLSAGVYNFVGGLTGQGGHLSYHFNSTYSKGFEIGITVTKILPSPREPNASDSTQAFISLGYEF